MDVERGVYAFKDAFAHVGLVRAQSNAQQNIDKLHNLTMGTTINNESTTTERLAACKPLGGGGGGGGL